MWLLDDLLLQFLSSPHKDQSFKLFLGPVLLLEVQKHSLKPFGGVWSQLLKRILEQGLGGFVVSLPDLKATESYDELVISEGILAQFS